MVAAVVLSVVAVLGAGVGMIPMLRSVLAPEARLTADGAPAQIRTGEGDRLMLWVWDSSSATPTCAARDTASGAELALARVTGLHHEGRSGYYRSIARFEARSDDTTVTCTGDGAVFVTEAYDGRWMLERLAPVFGPFLLCAGAGAGCLLIWLRGRAR